MYINVTICGSPYYVGGFSYSTEVILCCLKAFSEGSDFSQPDGPKTGQSNILPCVSDVDGLKTYKLSKVMIGKHESLPLVKICISYCVVTLVSYVDVYFYYSLIIAWSYWQRLQGKLSLK